MVGDLSHHDLVSGRAGSKFRLVIFSPIAGGRLVCGAGGGAAINATRLHAGAVGASVTPMRNTAVHDLDAEIGRSRSAPTGRYAELSTGAEAPAKAPQAVESTPRASFMEAQGTPAPSSTHINTSSPKSRP